jgi:uncharacterized repeat protein (TIGR01451 family)
MFMSHQEAPLPRKLRLLSTLCLVALSLAAGPLMADTNLTLTKVSDPETVAIGNDITYIVQVNCHGPDDAEDVEVEDTLPAGTTFVSASGTGWTCGEALGVVTCTYDTTMVKNSVVAPIEIVVTAPATATAPGSPLVNSAVATSSTTEVSPANNDDQAETIVISEGVYYTVTPCRLLDTRQVGQGGAFSGDETRTYAVDEFVDCGISPTAQAMSVNVTVFGATADGAFNVYAEDLVSSPDTDILLFNTSNNRANNAVVGLAAGQFDATSSLPALGTAHLIIDVNGYFE